MKHQYSRVLSALAVVLAFANAPTAAPASIGTTGIVVSPSAQATTEGDINNGYPFNLNGISSQRYQQVYSASDFTAFGGTPRFITQVAFRPDAIYGSAFNGTLFNVQIDLSTTTKAVDGLDKTFANNVGTDHTIVHSGSLSLSSAFTGPGGGPKTFDIVIPLSTPFPYNPSLGNLLLDVRNFNGGQTTQFDAQDTVGDTSSRAYSLSSVNDTSGEAGSSWALVTQFTFTSIPEPTGALQLALSLALAAVARRRRGRG